MAVLRIATPLILGTLGVLLCERAGVLNLGIEGIMVAGAFTGWLAVYQGGGPVDRRGVAALTGALFGLLHGWLTVSLALSQHVSGLGITLFATSLASYAYRVSFPKVDSPPTIQPFAEMAWLPMPVLNAQTPLTLLALLLVPAHRLRCCTARRSGWRVRMVGENPAAAEGQGLSVARRAHRRGHRRLGADGRGRRVPHAGGVQRVLLQHGQRPRLGLRGAGGVRVVAAGQGAARRAAVRASSTRCSCGCSSRARAVRRGSAVPGLPDAALRPVRSSRWCWWRGARPTRRR